MVIAILNHPYICTQHELCAEMKGIKVGNILMFRKCAVCIVCGIKKMGNSSCIIGVDSSNTIHEGTPDNWEPILHKMDKLKHFEDNILSNIVSSR